MSGNDKEYDFLLKFLLHEVFVTGTIDEIHFLAISENEVELLTNTYLQLQLNLLNNILF